jgi:hypothetical protein
MIDSIIQTQLLSPRFTSSRNHEVDLLLIDLTLDVFALGKFNHHCSYICRFLDENECRDEKSSSERDADIKE